MKTITSFIRSNRGAAWTLAMIAAAAIVAAMGFLMSGTSQQLLSALSAEWRKIIRPVYSESTSANTPETVGKNRAASNTVELTSSQLEAVKIGPVGKYAFPVDNETVGSIDFDEDLSVPVFPAYQGTIIDTLAELGNEVQKDQPLYTIKSPDLIQAESGLIAAVAAYDLTTKELARAQTLKQQDGISQREIEQATSDQLTAEGGLKAARDAVRVFGKTDSEIDRMIASRQIDPALVVRSPITGKITARNAQPGFLVKPGVAPAPYSVADVRIRKLSGTAQ